MRWDSGRARHIQPPRRWRPSVAAMFAVFVLAAACTSANSAGPSSTGQAGSGTVATGSSPAAAAPATDIATSASPTPSPSSTGPRRGSGQPVHVSLYEGDGTKWGVAMPIIVFFSAPVTDASVFDEVARVTVNGKRAHGAWYWERSSQSAYAMEAHYRLPHYWPAHSKIRVSLPVKGLWAGPHRVFDDSLTLRMRTGAKHIVHIDGKPGVDSMRIWSDGKFVRKLKVSLGAADTPTYRGTAVVISKSNPQLMVSSPGEPYYRLEVPWSVRVTYDGEFIHDAYWNGELGQANLSHGCTNLSPSAAKWYYKWSLIGDPVTWTHTGTRKVLPVWDGWGDWNLPFRKYARGGLLHP